MTACVGSIYLIFAAFSIRGDDLVIGSSSYQFSRLGTCVAVPHVKNAENLGLNKNDYKCSQDENKEKMFKNLIGASVHSLYYASQQASLASNSAVQAASTSAISATLGGDSSTPLNSSLFYDALVAIDGLTVPKSCDTIYSKTAADYDASFTGAVPEKPVVSCDGAISTTGSYTDVAADTAKLYTHCVQQHSYARAGPDDGTFAMPLVPAVPGPMSWFWANVSHFNESSTWDVKSRMFIGCRFNWAVTAYVPMILSTGFFAMHSAAVVLAEVTFPQRAEPGKPTRPGRLGNAIASIIATTNVKRLRAQILGLILVIVAWVVYAFGILIPWGFSSRMPRPQCETKREDYIFLSTGDLNQFYSKAGWKLDWTAHICELFALIACTFTLVAIPISEYLYQFPDTRTDNSLIPTSRVRKIRSDDVPVDKRSRLTATLIPLCLLGTAILITGSALVQNAFGMSWARAVSGEPGLGWDSETLGLPLYDMAKGWLFAVLTAGMIHGAVQARWSINGINCNMILIFSLWVVFAVGAFIPLVLFYNISYFTDSGEATKDCKIFETGGSSFDKDVCWFKYIGMIIGTITLAAVVALQTALGYLGYLPLALDNPPTADLYENQTEQAASGVQDPAASYVGNNRGYYSKDEQFFNFSTRIDVDASRKLLSKSPLRDTAGTLPAKAATPKLPAFHLPIRMVSAAELSQQRVRPQ